MKTVSDRDRLTPGSTPVILKQKKRVKPLNLLELENYVSHMNMHYMFHTNAQIARTLEATDDEKDAYYKHLEESKAGRFKHQSFVDFILH